MTIQIKKKSDANAPAALSSDYVALYIDSATNQIRGKDASGNIVQVALSSLADGSVTTAKIADEAVTDIKLADAPINTFRAVGSDGRPTYLSATQLTAELNLFTRTLRGLVPPSGGTIGTTRYLREDGQFAEPSVTGGASVYYNLVTDGGFVQGEDNTARFLAAATAAAAAGKTMWLPDGEYLINDAVFQLGPSLPEFLLDGTGTFTYNIGDGVFDVRGEWSSEYTISVFENVVFSGTTTSPSVSRYTVNTAAGLARGDIVKIFCNTRYPYLDGNGKSPFIGEMLPIMSVDSANNRFNTPVFFERDLFAASTSKFMRKMIPRRVSIKGVTFKGLGNIYDSAITSRKEAMILTGLVRPVIDVTIERASEIGIREVSCYMSDIKVRLVELVSLADPPIAFGYGIHCNNGSTAGSYRFLGETGRHLFTTDFDDKNSAFSSANYLLHGAVFFPNVYDSVSHGATSTPFDTHEFCYFPVFKNCSAYRAVVDRTVTNATYCFNHRAFSPTYIGCVAYGGLNGFQDTSSQYAFGHTSVSGGSGIIGFAEPGVAQYIDCIAINQADGNGFTLFTASSTNADFGGATKNDQHVYLKNCLTIGSRKGISMLNGGVAVISNTTITGFINNPITFDGDVDTDSVNLVLNDVVLDYSRVGASAGGIRNFATANRKNLKILVNSMIVKGSTVRPSGAVFEMNNSPLTLNLEARGIVASDRRLILVNGTIPVGSRIYAPDMGAGPSTAYGTVPDVGDVSLTINNYSDNPFLIWNTPLTANRTITLNTTNARKGERRTFARSRNATGAPTLEIVTNTDTSFTTNLVIAIGTSRTVEFDGALWHEV